MTIYSRTPDGSIGFSEKPGSPLTLLGVTAPNGGRTNQSDSIQELDRGEAFTELFVRTNFRLAELVSSSKELLGTKGVEALTTAQKLLSGIISLAQTNLLPKSLEPLSKLIDELFVGPWSDRTTLLTRFPGDSRDLSEVLTTPRELFLVEIEKVHQAINHIHRTLRVEFPLKETTLTQCGLDLLACASMCLQDAGRIAAADLRWRDTMGLSERTTELAAQLSGTGLETGRANILALWQRFEAIRRDPEQYVDGSLLSRTYWNSTEVERLLSEQGWVVSSANAWSEQERGQKESEVLKRLLGPFAGLRQRQPDEILHQVQPKWTMVVEIKTSENRQGESTVGTALWVAFEWEGGTRDGRYLPTLTFTLIDSGDTVRVWSDDAFHTRVKGFTEHGAAYLDMLDAQSKKSVERLPLARETEKSYFDVTPPLEFSNMSPRELRVLLSTSLEVRKYVRECGHDLRTLEIELHRAGYQEEERSTPPVRNATPGDAARLLRATLADPSYQRLTTILEIARRFDISIPTDSIFQEVQDRALLGELRLYETVCRELSRPQDRKIWTVADTASKALYETLQLNFRRALDSPNREFVQEIADQLRARWEPHYGGSTRDHFSASQWVQLATKLSLDDELADFASQFMDTWSGFAALAVEATLALRSHEVQLAIALLAADKGVREVIRLNEAIGAGPREWERAVLGFRKRGEAELEIIALEHRRGPDALQRREFLEHFRALTGRESTIDQAREAAKMAEQSGDSELAKKAREHVRWIQQDRPDMW